MTGLLWQEGWQISRSRAERSGRKQEGLKVTHKHPKRVRLWLADGSRIRLRPLYKNRLWSWGLVMDMTTDGRPLKILTLIDELTKEAPAIDVARCIRAHDVIDLVADVMIEHWRGL